MLLPRKANPARLGAMAKSNASRSRPSAAPCRKHYYFLQKALLVSSLLAIVATDAAGAGQNPQYCPPSSCGHLRNISYPFRLQGDSRQCVATPRPWYNLSCSNTGKATIQINTRTYYVSSIDYTGEVFSVVDATLQDDDTNGSSCPFPRSDHLPYTDYWPPYLGESSTDSYGFVYLATTSDTWACFVNCSRAITDTMPWYRPVTCLLPNNSFVFVSSSKCAVGELQPSCRYLAMIPFDDWHISDNSLQLQNASYTDIIGFIRKGFYVKFPYQFVPYQHVRMSATECLKDSKRYFKQHTSRASIQDLTRALFWSETYPEVECVYQSATKKDIIFLGIMVSAIDITKFHFVLGSLVVFIFLTHKYWKTRITIDAVEKFLRMHQMIGPTRFAYTDIIAITAHFRDKLGQGGYGSVYKGVLLPGNVHIAVKMLTGSSSCNGDEFISEVSTIGRIHHVNVVRLVGFCSEEMRRALVYEYMPRGSLDKYIFSSEKSFSWDKLNEIALGIARGINYLHQGCEMQILHFDIKPHNILLDDNFAPKVADFGLAKLYPRDKSFVPVSAARGTVGYIAPEMISRSFGVISSKSDVYSFGMLLLEMAGGRRNADPNAANSSQAYYPSRVYRELTRRETSEISDIDDMHELEKKLCIVGLWCIQMRSCDRPTMSEVIEMLEGGTDELQVPPRPFFCDDEQFPGVDSYNMPSELTAISEEHEDDDDDSICSRVKVIAATSSVAAFVVLLLMVATALYLSLKTRYNEEIHLKVEMFLKTYGTSKPTRYTFSEVKKISRRFKVKVGQGGFGSVYRGELPNGVPVAVKMLENSLGEGDEFINEVATIGRIHHANIVRLLGFCSEGTRRALIYEYMPNDSLEKYIFSHDSDTSQQLLVPSKMLDIALGIARGMEYLHQGCNQRILHFDIKPNNILLDYNFSPKISDFGLAKLCARDQSIVTLTAARGTMGYIAPELYSRNFGEISYKSDVYSFGMLVLEMVSGRRNSDPSVESQNVVYFPEWIYEQVTIGRDLELGREMSEEEKATMRQLAIVALWCIQWNPKNRPSMTKVVNMLTGRLQNLQVPPKPFFSADSHPVLQDLQNMLA
uniref:Protein kinase domain-containing protein n=1 Tax=Oryza meridionalis TaxID=40149 RepID=A0A0E0BW51_9ORYZ